MSADPTLQSCVSIENAAGLKGVQSVRLFVGALPVLVPRQDEVRTAIEDAIARRLEASSLRLLTEPEFDLLEDRPGLFVEPLILPIEGNGAVVGYVVRVEVKLRRTVGLWSDPTAVLYMPTWSFSKTGAIAAAQDHVSICVQAASLILDEFLADAAKANAGAGDA